MIFITTIFINNINDKTFMSDLEETLEGEFDELGKRLTIEFPIPITYDEVENGVFEYLRSNVDCEIHYYPLIQARKVTKQGVNLRSLSGEDEKYTREIRGDIRRPLGSGVIATIPFQMPRGDHREVMLPFFLGIRFESIGHDSLQELQFSPSGKDELKLIHEVRKATEDYFSQRPK